ncbi:MAG: hypothetical protein RO257_10685 [Candidatus Kapabacteria bacterium]|nr:hypothetical protein [Candidatus Kapabacteria bacterium]
MQTFLLKIDDTYVPYLMDLISPIPQKNFEIRNLDFEVDSDISLLEDEIAYRKALLDIVKGDVIELDDYLAKRGIS